MHARVVKVEHTIADYFWAQRSPYGEITSGQLSPVLSFLARAGLTSAGTDENKLLTLSLPFWYLTP
jgi:hypothetical protein